MSESRNGGESRYSSSSYNSYSSFSSESRGTESRTPTYSAPKYERITPKVTSNSLDKNKRDDKGSCSHENRNEDKKFEAILPIKYGDKGKHIEKLQELFNTVSKYYNFLDTLVKDGIFGPNMERFIKNFQRRFGLIE